MVDVICSVDGCDRTDRIVHGWCGLHYKRWYKHGDAAYVVPVRPLAKCSVDGCNKQERRGRKGWCGAHYQRWYTFGDPLGSSPRRSKGTCSVDGCDLPHNARGLCHRHYSRMKVRGTTDARPRPSAADRLWAKVDKNGPLPGPTTLAAGKGPCWLWTGHTVSNNGYGTIKGQGKGSVVVHRLAYELLVGPIPDGLHLDHLCRVTLCCNPEHLEPVTQAENNRRAAEAKTHCIKGHDWSDPRNVYTRPNGRRCCAECNRISCTERYRRRQLERAA